MNTMPKFVISTTLKSTEWNNSTIIIDNIAAQIKSSKNSRAKIFWWQAVGS